MALITEVIWENADARRVRVVDDTTGVEVYQRLEDKTQRAERQAALRLQAEQAYVQLQQIRDVVATRSPTAPELRSGIDRLALVCQGLIRLAFDDFGDTVGS